MTPQNVLENRYLAVKYQVDQQDILRKHYASHADLYEKAFIADGLFRIYERELAAIKTEMLVRDIPFPDIFEDIQF